MAHMLSVERITVSLCQWLFSGGSRQHTAVVVVMMMSRLSERTVESVKVALMDSFTGWQAE